MSAILTLQDFEEGHYRIPTGVNQEEDLQEVIDITEAKYLPELLGVELADLLKADLVAGYPQSPRFVAIFDPFSFQETDCYGKKQIYQSLGMRDLLKGIVYFLYARDTMTRLTDNGAKITRSENSETPSNQKHDSYSRYNRSVDYWRAIQRKIEKDEATYPEYDGLEIEKAIRY